jgi:hypothetical protein
MKLEPARAVSTLNTDVETDFAPPLSMFAHSWVKGGFDSDSDDDRELIAHKQGRTLGGAAVAERPLRSTFALRQEQRHAPQEIDGVVRVEAGEVQPSRARQELKPEEDRSKAFAGKAHHIPSRKKKGLEEVEPEREEPEPEKEKEELPKQQVPSPVFTGKGRKLWDQPTKQQPVHNEVPKEGVKSAFSGKGRKLNEAPAEPVPLLPPSPAKPAGETSESFRGPGRKLGK